MPRDIFKSITFMKKIGSNLLELSNTTLNNEGTWKLRIKVFNLIGMLWIDDLYDNYIDAIDEVLIKLNFNAENVSKVINSQNIF